MEMKKNHIAVITENGKCIAIAKCKLVDDNELLRLQNQVNEHKQEEFKEKEELLNRLGELEKKCKNLEKEVKLLKGED